MQGGYVTSFAGSHELQRRWRLQACRRYIGDSRGRVVEVCGACLQVTTASTWLTYLASKVQHAALDQSNIRCLLAYQFGGSINQSSCKCLVSLGQVWQ